MTKKLKIFLNLSITAVSTTPALALVACGTTTNNDTSNPGTGETPVTNSGEGHLAWEKLQSIVQRDLNSVEPSYGFNDTNATKEGYLQPRDAYNVINPVVYFDNSIVSDSYAKDGYLQHEYNSIFTNLPWLYDNSSSSGGRQQPLYDTTVSSFISIQHTGTPIIETEKTLDETTLSETTVEHILRPSVSRRKFELADAIIIITSDGQEHVFDSDDASLVPAPTIDGKYYAFTSIERSSNDPKSINSENFNAMLKQAQSVKFRVKKGNFWVDQNGQKTPYEITAKDFLVGLLRTQFIDVDFRRKNGGSKQVDDLVTAALLNLSKGRFDDDSRYNNKYLYNLFNINFDNMLDESKALSTDDQGNTYFSVGKVEPGLSAQFTKLIDDLVATSYDFVPAPSAYINAKNEEVSNDTSSTAEKVKEIFKPTTTTFKQEEDLFNGLKNVNGLAKEAGIYWYGASLDQTLFSGKYYAVAYNPDTQIVATKLNTHYADQNFVNDPRTIKEFRNKYTTTTIEEKTFDDQSWKNYLSGTEYRFAWSTLSEAERTKVSDKSSATNNPYGLSYSKVLSKNKFTRYQTWNLIPDSGADNSSVSDAYIKLMYGGTRDQLSNGTLANNIENITLGMGAEFNSLISTAIDWAAYAQNQYGPSQQKNAWVTAFSPDSLIVAGNDEDKTAANTLRENSKLINSFFAVDSANGTRVQFDGVQGTLIQPGQSVAIKNSDTLLQSPVFEQVKTKFKALLDRFYAANPELQPETNANDKIRINVLYRFNNLPGTMTNTYELIQAVLNSLDSRFEFSIRRPKDRDEWQSFWLNGASPVGFVGWGYDYDGIGSGIDGYSHSNAVLNTALFKLISDDAYAQKMEALYPRLVAASKAFKKLVDTLNADGSKQKLSLTPQQISGLTTKQLSTLGNILGVKRFNENNELVDIPAEETSQYISLELLMSTFWLTYTTSNSSVTKLQLVELAQEISNIYGAYPDVAMAVSVKTFTETLSNPNYVIPANYSDFDDLTTIKTAQAK
ncbi:hypothetical protein H9M94_02460 [Mycoplasma sp. Pen4]|uniref:OppA family ABC transporter substrate-binding lipoprotein n=1 Tax=Mycoplasma sp. Pen4 TaxID=640330 RepID=UPI001654B5EA|nr:hypothetical protein [Mycoplasma sp. Pen4]QNM93450.1 hypothetical protein H9M94_02460 [Mycoplasma sp. Pen4]